MNTKNELKSFFENGKVPNQDQYWSWMDSYWHKDESMDLEKILYTNDKPTAYQVGGIPAGTTFSEMPISEVLNFILYGKKTVTIAITTSPVGASVSFEDPDGHGGLGDTIIVYEGTVLYYRVRMEGYIEKTGRITATEDMTIHVTLDPEV